MKAKRRAAVLGVPLDLGASKQGASGGPAAIRRAGLLKLLSAIEGLVVDDVGDIAVALASTRTSGRLKNAAPLLSTCRALEKRVAEIARSGTIPVCLGGDHSLAVGSVSGLAASRRAHAGKIGLIWVDAHADINTPQTSPTGNAHGMPVAHLLGLGDKDFAHIGGFAPKVEPRNVCLVGVRDVDKSEAVNIRASGIHVFSMQEIDRFGMGVVTEQAIDLASDGTDGFHLSFDIDSVDPGNAPGTGTLKRGGLTYREAHLLMELAADSERLLGLDMVEINPLEDMQNSTAVLAVELIASALGKTIY